MNLVSMTQVLIYVNNVCDKGCPNCFYPLVDSTVSDDHVISAAKWIIEDKIVARNYSVEFLGGEPMLAFDKILKAVDYMLAHKPEGSQWLYNKTASVFTNGDPLTKENLREMRSRRIAISLNPTHDAISILRDKLELIKSIMKGCRMALVFDEYNLSRVEDLTKLAIEYGCHIRTNRLYDGGNNPEYVEAYKVACLKMLDIIMTSDKLISPQWLIETTVVMPHDRYGGGQVGYYAVIDRDGTVRSCNPDQDSVIGNIYTHTMSDLKDKCEHFEPGCHHWHVRNIPECQDCEWGWVCRGGCPYTRKCTYGTYDIKSPFCSAFKELFPVVMKLVKKWKERYPV